MVGFHVAFALSSVNCEQALCDIVSNQRFDKIKQRGKITLSTCSFYKTEIKKNHSTILSAEATALVFTRNYGIYYLPIEVAISFPELIVYEAEATSITSIAKINFKDLNKVKSLNLRRNEITTIKSNTFEDMASLDRLLLGNQKLSSFVNLRFHSLSSFI